MNEAGELETWEYLGGAWAAGSFSQVGAAKLSELGWDRGNGLIIGENIRFESGTYNNLTGEPLGNRTRLRTGLFSYVTNIVLGNGNYQIVQAFYYSEKDTPSWKRTVNVLSNEYQIEFGEGENYIALSFKKLDGSTLDYNSVRDMNISFGKNLLDRVDAAEKGLVELSSSVADVSKDTEKNSSEIEVLKTGIGLSTQEIDYSTHPSLFYSISDGSMKGGGYTCSDLYSLNGALNIKINARAQVNAAGVCFFSSDKAFISGINTMQGEEVELSPDDFPENAAYAGFSASTSYPYQSSITYVSKQQQGESAENAYASDVYKGKKLCTIGSSSTAPCEWQKHIVKWLGLEFSEEETKNGVGYVKVKSDEEYWIGTEYSLELPKNVTATTIDVSLNKDGSKTIEAWQDSGLGKWRRAFKLAEGGNIIKAGHGFNIFAYAFDIEYYNPDIVMIMCYNEINYMTADEPFGELGKITDAPAMSPNIKASIISSYKAVIEHIMKTLPGCEVVLVTTKLNTYQIYGATAEIDVGKVRESSRWKKDKAYHDAMYELSDYYGVKVIDLLENTGLTPWTVVPYMQALDNVHCNEEGQLHYIANNLYKGYLSS